MAKDAEDRVMSSYMELDNPKKPSKWAVKKAARLEKVEPLTKLGSWYIIGYLVRKHRVGLLTIYGALVTAILVLTW